MRTRKAGPDSSTGRNTLEASQNIETVTTGCIGRLKPVASSVRYACIPAGLALFLSSNPVFAGPEGGVVSAGEGDISTPDATTTNINQYTNKLVIDWRTFNLAQDETVQFIQPSSTSTALNRIHDQNPSLIFGSIIANGNVILLNASGVFFGPTASVNVNSLIASSMNITDDDFMAGNYIFQAPPGQEGGVVVNQGVIQAATGGSVTLMGGAVSNEGVILAHAGQVNLVAGNQVTMDFDGDGLMQFTINKEVLSNAQALDSAVNNSGTIEADGGAVLLKGSAAAEVFSNVVNNSGIIKAGRIENQGGTIRLVASGSGASVINTGTLNADAADSTSDGGTVEITGANVTQSGTVTADSTGGEGGTINIQSSDTTLVNGNSVTSATSETGEGGTIHVLGDNVGLLDLASIDVSGALGGGEVLVGGDYQGANPNIQNASRTYVLEGATIKADATQQGDGGKVIVWSNEYTKYYGNISAKGGPEGGDGGFAEVSGAHLVFDGNVDLTAARGAVGTLLLDPVDIVITGGTSDGSDDEGGNSSTLFQEGGDQTVDFTETVAADPFIIFESELEGTTSNIILRATKTITTTGTFGGSDITLANDVSLTLETRNNSTDGAGGIDLTTSTDGNNLEIIAQGTGSITINGSTDGGSAGNIKVGLLTTTGTGGISLDTNNGTITVDGDITTGSLNTAGVVTSGSINLAATGLVTINAAITTGGAISSDNDATSGSITITTTGGGITTNNNGTLTTGNADSNGADGDSATSGNITLNAGTGAVTLNDAVETGFAQTDDDIALTGTISITGTGISTITNGTLLTGQAESLGNDNGDDASSGNITLSATGGAVAINDDITTSQARTDNGGGGDATSGFINISGASSVTLNTTQISTGLADSNANGQNASSGLISITSTGSIIGGANATLMTGDALADGGGGSSVIATTGEIVLNVTGAGTIQLAAANSLLTGDADADASGNNDTETVGNITLTGDKVSSNGTNGAIDVSIGTLAGGGGATTNNGVLSVTTDGGAGDAGGIFVTSGETLLVGALQTDGGNSQNVTVSTTGGAALTVTNAGENLDDDAVTLNSGTGTLTLADISFDVGAGSLTLIGDEIDLTGGANSVKGTGGGTVSFAPSTNLIINVGSTAGANVTDLDLSATDVAALANGFSSITIGDGSNVAINIGTSSFQDPVIFNSGTSTINVSNTLSGTDDASVTMNGPTTFSFNGTNISTESGAITLNGAVTLAANAVTLDTTAAGSSGGDVNFNNTVDADDATTNDRALVVNAGTAGIVTFGSTVGTTQALADLDVSAATINLNAASYVINDQGGNTLTLDGAVILGTDVSISTNGTSDNNITFMGTVDSASGTTKDLTLDLDTGDLDFQGDVGTTDSLDAFTVTDAHDVTIEGQFIANSFTQTAGSGTNPTTIIGGTSATGNGGDMTIADDININTAFITIQDNVTSTNGDIRFTVTDNITVTVDDLTGDPVDPTAGADVDAGEDGAVVRDVEAQNGFIFITGDGSATLLLKDQCLAGDCTVADGSASIPTDRLISRIIASEAVVINPSTITTTIETNVNNTSWPQIINQAGFLDCGSVDCFLGDDSGTPTFTDAQILAAFGTTSILFITQTTDVNIVLDMAGAATGKTIFISSEGDIFDNSVGLAYQGAGLELTTTGGAIGDDSDAVATPDGTLTIDVSSFVVNDTGGNNVSIANTASFGDAVYAINTGGAGDILVSQSTNDLLIGGTGITTTGNVTLTSSAGAINLDPLALTGVITANTLIMSAKSGIGTSIDPIATSVSTLNALNTTTGDIYIDNTGTALTLDDVGFLGCGFALCNLSGGSVTITNDNSIDVPGTSGDGVGAFGDVNVIANGTNSDITAEGNFFFTFYSDAANVTLSAGRNVTLGVTATSSATVFAADNVSITAGTGGAGDILIKNTSSVSAGGDLDMDSADNIAQESGTQVTASGSTSLNAGTGSISLGEIINDFGGDVSADAATDINLGDANSISVEEINAGGNVTLTALTGAITDADTSDDTIANIIATDLTMTATAVGGSFGTANNDLDITITGVLNVDTSAGAAGTRSVFIESTGDLALGQIATESNVVPTLPAGTGDDVKLVVNGALTDADTGNDSLTVGAGSYGDINIVADGITIVADSVGASGTGDIDILMATTINQGLNIDTSASSGDVFIESPGNLLIGLIDAGTGNVNLTATSGVVANPAIVNANVTLDATANIIGSALTVTTPGTIFLDTDITSLSASTTTNGAIAINELDYSTLDGLVLSGSLSTQGGLIQLQVAGTFDDQGNNIETTGTGAGGAVSIATTGGTSDITLSGGIDTSGANGGADQNGFNAGTVTINAGGVVTISNTITATGGDANDTTTDGFPKTGGAGGTVTITANNGGVSVDAIDTSGGAGDTAADGVGAGGVAGGISITSTNAGDVDLNANLTAIGGLNTDATHAAGGAVTITSDNAINFVNPITIDAGNGSIALRVDNSNAQTVTLDLANGTFNASAVTFTGGTDADDTLVPHDLTNTWTITGVNDGTLSNSKITGTAAAQFIDFNITGGTAADTFTFTNTGSLTGALDGGGGTDMLVGDDDGNLFTITGADSGTMTSIGGGWSNIENLKGGTFDDTFNITTGGTLSGNIDGNTGIDTLSYAGGPAATVTITGAGSLDGAQGSATDTGGFDNINNLIGSANADTFTVNGSFIGSIDGAGGDNTFDINATITGNLTGGTGINTFNINSGGNVTGFLTINSADTTTGDLLNFSNSITGVLNIQGNATWNSVNSNDEMPLTTNAVTGGGNLIVPVIGDLDVYEFLPLVDPSGFDLNLLGFNSFGGHLVIGGIIDPITDKISQTTTIDITAGNLSINPNDCACTSGNLTLLGANIILNGNFTIAAQAGGQLTLIAIDEDPNLIGNISAPQGPIGLNAPQIFLIAEGEILNSTNVNVFGGTVEIATGQGPDLVQLGSFSTSVGGNSADFDNLVNLVNANFFAGGNGLNVIQFQTFTLLLQLLEQLGYIDTGLFEQDLDLFGIIGTGIAMSLAQCEEIDGCAPNVTEEELNELISQLEARITELEKRIEEGDSDPRLPPLLEGYKKQLQSFVAYREELHEYMTAGQEEEQAVPDEFGGEPSTPAAMIESLAKALEGVKSRITWLESLKGDPELREKMSKKTGIELTQEALDALIEGAKAEAQSIEQQIKLLQEAPQTSIDTAPMFIAEAGDYSRVYNVNYGPALLDLAQGVATTGTKLY